jgi:hypothetical protein
VAGHFVGGSGSPPLAIQQHRDFETVETIDVRVDIALDDFREMIRVRHARLGSANRDILPAPESLGEGESLG